MINECAAGDSDPYSAVGVDRCRWLDSAPSGAAVEVVNTNVDAMRSAKRVASAPRRGFDNRLFQLTFIESGPQFSLDSARYEPPTEG